MKAYLASAALGGLAAATAVAVVSFVFPQLVPAGARPQATSVAELVVASDDLAELTLPDGLFADTLILPAATESANREMEPLPIASAGRASHEASPGLSPQLVVVAESVPPQLSESDTIYPALLDPGPDLLRAKALSGEIAPELAFAEPNSFTRDDLKTGFAELMALMSGEDLAGVDKSIASDKFASLTEPVIYVRHGLGASPEKVREVMESLASAGYKRVFRVAVPYRIGRTNVRFYHGEDSLFADQIAGSIMPLVDGPRFSGPRDFSGFSDPPEAGTIEIWLSDKS